MITLKDKELYEGMFGDDGIYNDIMSWDVTTPINLYKTKRYKDYVGAYKGGYMITIIRALILYHTVKGGVFKGKLPKQLGIYYVGNNKMRYSGIIERNEEDDTPDTWELDSKDLQEFIDYVGYNAVVNYIEGGKEDTHVDCGDSMWSVLYLLNVLIKDDGGMGDLGREGSLSYHGNDFLMEMVQYSVNDYLKLSGKGKDKHINKRYRELQNRVLKEMMEQQLT